MLKMYQRIPLALSLLAASIAQAYDPYLPSVTALSESAPYSVVVDDVGNAITPGTVIPGVNADGGYAYFNGSTSALTVNNATDLASGTGALTLELIFFHKTPGVAQTLMDTRGAPADNGLAVTVLADNTVNIWGNNHSVVNSVDKLRANDWNHIALVRSGTLFKIYINGVWSGTSAAETFSVSAISSIVIGRICVAAGSSNFTKGYFDSIRLTKAAVYTGAFTPPTTLTMNAGDPNWANVYLAIDFTNGFVDLKGHNIVTGDVVKMMPDKFGNRVTYLAGSGYAVAQPATAAIGTGEFVTEGWFQPTLAGAFTLLDYRPTNTNGNYLTLSADANGKLLFTYNGVQRIIGSTIVSLNAWHHVALLRRGNTIYLYLDGVLEGSTVEASSILLGAAKVGTNAFGGAGFTGYVGQVRQTNGQYRYTDTAGKIDVPVTAFSDYRIEDYYWENTALVMSLKDATDAKGHVFTNTGVVFNSTQVKYETLSAYFNGAAYLSTPASADLNFGTEAFSMDGFAYLEALPGVNASSRFISGGSQADGAGKLWAIGASNYGGVMKLSFAYWNGSGYDDYTVNFDFRTKQWYHIAVVRKAGTLYLFVNGTLLTSVAMAGAVNTGAAGLMLGARYSTNNSTRGDYLNGYLSGWRVTRGVGRATTSFIVPQGKLPTYAPAPDKDFFWKYNTLVLDGQTLTDKSNAARTLTLYGDGAKISTAVSKFNGHAIEIPLGHCLLAGSNVNMLFGTGDLTMDAWVYPTTANTQYGMPIFATYNSSGSDNGWTFGINRTQSGSSGAIFFSISVGGVTQTVYYTGANLAINTWHHVAVVRIAGVVYLLLNGNVVASGPLTSNDTFVSELMIGTGNASNKAASNSSFGGYIGQGRITRGVGRWPGSFTPQTVAAQLQ